MKKEGALTGRAALIAGISIAVALVSSLALGTVLVWRSQARAVERRLLSAVNFVSESASEDVEQMSVAFQTLEANYGIGQFEYALLDMTRATEELPGELSAARAEALISPAYQGYANSARYREENGVWAAYAAVPMWENGILTGVLAARVPVDSITGYLPWAGIALLVAAALSALVAFLLIRKQISPVAGQIRALKDVAFSVAGSDFDAHADETLPGELGELAVSLNNLSQQLSRNMYMLIVERNRLKHVLDGLSEGIVAIDNKGRITHHNPALEEMFSLTARLVGADARMRLIPEKTIWEDFDQVLASGKSITRSMEQQDKTLRIVISPIVDEIGDNAGAVGLFSDITQMERLERTRRDYVANVSHEMRTPLTAMRALIEPLKEGMVTTEEDRMRYYDIIMREILRLTRLINDLMELSRLQSGTMSIQTRPMILEDLVMDVCERYSSIAEDHGLTFTVNGDMSACPTVISNADRVEQLLVILLDNAIKYTPEGGTITLGATWDEQKVVMSVADTGIGISPEDLPYVFDRFYKVDKAHSGMGSGLGLSIARELLKWMNEEIWVSSEQGKGTTFYFTIRRAVARTN